VAETVGWLADKLSIVELRMYHIAERAAAPDAPQALREECSQRLDVLRMQRDDLADELSTLLADIASGKVVPKVYRQFKLYNDPRYRKAT
jgi:hypothetical protein